MRTVIAEAAIGRRRGQGERRRRVRRRAARRSSLPRRARRRCAIFWDVDAPATLAELRRSPDHPLHRAMPSLDLVLTYGGGRPSSTPTRASAPGAACRSTTRSIRRRIIPVPPEARFAADLAFLGNRLPDREARVEEFFLDPAARLPDRRFLLGGNGWDDKAMPPNVRHIGHVYTREHNAFNRTPARRAEHRARSMADIGFSPATRVFEAAGAGACLITDAWEGIEHFLEPGRRGARRPRRRRTSPSTSRGLTPERARADRRGGAAPACSAEHTYAQRGAQVDAILTRGRGRRSGRGASHEARRPRPQPVLVLGQRPRDHLPRAAQGLCRARPRRPVPGARRALVRGTTATSSIRTSAGSRSTTDLRRSQRYARGHRSRRRGDRRLLRAGGRRGRRLGAARPPAASPPSTTSTRR